MYHVLLLVVSIEKYFCILINTILHLRYQFWHVDLYFYLFLANIMFFFFFFIKDYSITRL
jgi:hypothetical protein